MKRKKIGSMTNVIDPRTELRAAAFRMYMHRQGKTVGLAGTAQDVYTELVLARFTGRSDDERRPTRREVTLRLWPADDPLEHVSAVRESLNVLVERHLVVVAGSPSVPRFDILIPPAYRKSNMHLLGKRALSIGLARACARFPNTFLSEKRAPEPKPVGKATGSHQYKARGRGVCLERDIKNSLKQTNTGTGHANTRAAGATIAKLGLEPWQVTELLALPQCTPEQATIALAVVEMAQSKGTLDSAYHLAKAAIENHYAMPVQRGVRDRESRREFLANHLQKAHSRSPRRAAEVPS